MEVTLSVVLLGISIYGSILAVIAALVVYLSIVQGVTPDPKPCPGDEGKEGQPKQPIIKVSYLDERHYHKALQAKSNKCPAPSAESSETVAVKTPLLHRSPASSPSGDVV